MKQKLKISIPEACHEPWNAMLPRQDGRYCENCRKVVTDFTTRSDQEIARYLASQPKGLCGRFREDQLNRVICSTAEEAGKTSWRKWLAGFFVAGGTYSSLAQNQTDSLKIQEKYPTELSDSLVSTDSLNKNAYFYGKVLDQSGKPLSGISVHFPELGLNTLTGPKGHFSIQIPDTVGDSIFQPQFTGETVKSKSLLITREELGSFQEIRLEEIEATQCSVAPFISVTTGNIEMGLTASVPEKKITDYFLDSLGLIYAKAKKGVTMLKIKKKSPADQPELPTKKSESEAILPPQKRSRKSGVSS